MKLYDVSYCGREGAAPTVETTIVAASYEEAEMEIERRNATDDLRAWKLIGEVSGEED
jgi:hypothetical protein